jgi:membrane protein
MSIKSAPVLLIRKAVAGFIAHDVLTLSAALSYYTLLSFAPLMILILWATSLMGWHNQDALLAQLAALAGEDARLAAKAVLESVTQRKSLGPIASSVGIVVVLIGATSVFAQLQATLNRIWDIPERPANAVWGWLRRRIISAGVLLAFGFLLVLSTLASSAIGLLLPQQGLLWDIINQLTTTILFGVLFALLYRYVPDARLPWTQAWHGAALTTVLFGIGKWAIGAYLAHGNVGGAYGAAGSFVVLLVWAYYSAVVFFFSAELVQAWLKQSDRSVDSSTLRTGDTSVRRRWPTA